MPDVEEVFRMATRTVGPDPGAQERQYTKQRRHAIKQKAGVYAVVAAVVIAGTVFGVATLGGDERGRPAAEGQPTALTRENLGGVWRTRAADAASATLLNFATDGEFALDNPASQIQRLTGTYKIQGDTLTLTNPQGCHGMKWTARLREGGGVLEFTLTAIGTGSCSAVLGPDVKASERFVFERLLPRFAANVDVDTAGRAEDGAPPSVSRGSHPLGDLTGWWLIDDGEKLLWINLAHPTQAEYAITSGGDKKAWFTPRRLGRGAPWDDWGAVRLEDDGSLVFSTVGGPTCPTEDPDFTETVWENVLLAGDAFAADIPSGACGDLAAGRASWLRISGSPSVWEG